MGCKDKEDAGSLKAYAMTAVLMEQLAKVLELPPLSGDNHHCAGGVMQAAKNRMKELEIFRGKATVMYDGLVRIASTRQTAKRMAALCSNPEHKIHLQIAAGHDAVAIAQKLLPDSVGEVEGAILAAAVKETEAEARQDGGLEALRMKDEVDLRSGRMTGDLYWGRNGRREAVEAMRVKAAT